MSSLDHAVIGTHPAASTALTRTGGAADGLRCDTDMPHTLHAAINTGSDMD